MIVNKTTLKDKIISDYEFYKNEESEKFSMKASQFINKKLKEFGIENIINFNGKIVAKNSTLVALFNIEEEDLTFGVSELMGQMMLFVVLKCKQCGYEDWDFIFTKDNLGYALNEFKIHHTCISLAERIAQDIDQIGDRNETPENLQDLLGCDGDCEECDEKEKE